MAAVQCGLTGEGRRREEEEGDGRRRDGKSEGGKAKGVLMGKVRG